MRNFDRSQRLIRYRSSDRSAWPGMAFILESLLLLLFVSASLAVLMSLFVQSQLLGEENVRRSEAIIVATNAAETFAADPTSLAPAFEQDGYQVSCEVEPQDTEAGTLMVAKIAVSFEDAVLYELTTAGYQSNHAGEGHVDAIASEGSSAGAGEEILDGPGGETADSAEDVNASQADDSEEAASEDDATAEVIEEVIE